MYVTQTVPGCTSLSVTVNLLNLCAATSLVTQVQSDLHCVRHFQTDSHKMQNNADPVNFSIQSNLLNQTLSPVVAHALDELFTLCRVPFVTDFLFTTDAVADISMLTSPVQNEHASVARIRVSGSESAPNPSAQFSYTDDIYFFSVPAFSVGAITVGYALQKRVDSSNYITADSSNIPVPPCKNITRPTSYRFVRDDARGIFILIAEFSTGVTEFDCMIHRSSRRRTHLNARFQTTAFRDALRTQDGILNIAAVAPSLQYLTIAYEQRACPVCKSDDNGECGCELPFQRPSHPLDFRSERCNMALNTGCYKGSSIAQVFGGVSAPYTLPIAVIRLNTFVAINGLVDRNLMSSLCRLAVQDRLLALSPNPIAASVPLNLPQQDLLRYSDGAPTELKNTKSVSTVPISTMPVPGSDSLFSQRESSIDDAKKGEFSSFGQPMDIAKSKAPPSQRGDLLDSLFDGLDEPALSVPIESINGVSNAASQAQHSNGSSARDEEKEISATDSDSSDEALSTTEKSSSPINAKMANLGVGSDKKTDSPSSRFRRARGKELEHESGRNSNGVGVTSINSRIGKERSQMDERAARAEERRRRNRLAAAKSNVKRKIRNETLKRDLSEARQRVSELREKEKELRAENVRLRVQAHQQKMNVGIHLTHIQMTTA